MTPELMTALSPIAGLAFNSCSLVCIYRSTPNIGLLRAEYIGFAIGAVVVLGINGAVFLLYSATKTSNIVGHLLLTTTSYAALGYCHFHFVNLGETARRIRLLRELYHASGPLSPEELLERYNAREIVARRIARLIGSGQILLKNGQYFIGNRTMVRIASFIIMLKVLLLGKTSEYDN